MDQELTQAEHRALREWVQQCKSTAELIKDQHFGKSFLSNIPAGKGPGYVYAIVGPLNNRNYVKFGACGPSALNVRIGEGLKTIYGKGFPQESVMPPTVTIWSLRVQNQKEAEHILLATNCAKSGQHGPYGGQRVSKHSTTPFKDAQREMFCDGLWGTQHYQALSAKRCANLLCIAAKYLELQTTVELVEYRPDNGSKAARLAEALACSDQQLPQQHMQQQQQQHSVMQDGVHVRARTEPAAEAVGQAPQQQMEHEQQQQQREPASGLGQLEPLLASTAGGAVASSSHAGGGPAAVFAQLAALLKSTAHGAGQGNKRAAPETRLDTHTTSKNART